jgi:WD40 repeat protein
MQSFRSAPRVFTAIVISGASVLYLAGVTTGAAEPDGPITLGHRTAPVLLGPHEHSITAVAFSPDGSTLATAANDGFLRFWDAGTGALLAIRGDDATRAIQALAFAPDGKRLAAVGGFFDKEVAMYDTTAAAIARPFAPISEAYESVTPVSPSAPFLYKGKPAEFRLLTALAYSPDGRLLATAPGGVVLRDTTTGNVVATLEKPAKGVKAVAFSPDGKLLATASDDKKVRLWNVADKALLATCDGPTQPLIAVAFSPDGQQIVAYSSGDRSLLDRTPTGSLWVWTLRGGRGRKLDLGKVLVGQVAFLAPDKVVVAAGREVLEVELQNDSAVHGRKLSSGSEDVLTVAISPDQTKLAFGGRDRTVDVIEVATGKLLVRLPGANCRFSAVAVADKGQRFATATIDYRFSNHLPTKDLRFAPRYQAYFSGDQNSSRMNPSEVRIWSSDEGRMTEILPLEHWQVTAIDFVPGGQHLVVAGWLPNRCGMLSVWDVTSGKQVREWSTGAAEVLTAAVAPDGLTLASGDAGGNLDVWDLQSGAKRRTENFPHPIESVTYSDDGKLLAAADANRTVRLFVAADGANVRALQSKSYIESIAFSSDGHWLATGTRAEGLELWDLRTDAGSRVLKAAGDYFETMPGFVAFSADGRLVACGGHGKDIAVFNVASGVLQLELRGHEHAATAAAFLPDGRLVSGGEEGAIRMWDPVEGKLLATWVTMPADANRKWADEWFGFTPGGRYVSSASQQRLVGWQSGGEIYIGRETPGHQRRVQRLFDPAP